MGEDCQSRNGSSDANAKPLVAALAARQAGRVTTAQLQHLGVTRTTIGRWIARGYLHPRLPRVYAVGSPTPSLQAAHFEAILYAGPGAMLSHATAAHQLTLIDHPPRAIHVRTPRRPRSLPGIVVHGRSTNPRSFHDRLPTTSIPDTLLDLAIPTTSIPDTLLDLATEPDAQKLLRRALARLDYTNRLCSTAALLDHCRPGRAGGAALRDAIVAYDPRFAYTRSPLEDDWIRACEITRTPKPDAVNVLIHGIRCDFVYSDAMLIVELDGIDNHRSGAQLRRDRRNDFTLRAHGWSVLRYGSDQLNNDLDAVTAEVRARLSAGAS